MLTTICAQALLNYTLNGVALPPTGINKLEATASLGEGQHN